MALKVRFLSRIRALVFLNKQEGGVLSRGWVLLDNQSTIDVSCNMGLLINVQQIIHSTTIKSNGGTIRTNMVGCFTGYDWVWFDPKSIVNIITLKI